MTRRAKQGFLGRKASGRTDQNNRRTVWRLSAVALCMFVFGYALVPLYDVLCEVTGLNGKTGRAEAKVAGKIDETRWVTVEFTGNSMSGLPWEFAPQQKTLRVHPGEVAVVYYQARNTAAESITGQAVPSVAPGTAAAHFKKIECFCFSQQQLKAGELKKMPVRFVVSTDLPKEVSTVTLSYAFFNADQVSAKKYGGSAPAVAGHEHHADQAHAAGG
jgi:cytochrome c oxidase assembly protein subunit 11